MKLKDGEKLVKLARNSISLFFSGSEPDISDVKGFNKKQGVFVTLHKNGQLRGCIGFPYPTYPLYEAIIKAARSAAFEDSRFPRVEENELNEIEIEISVLTVPEKIEARAFEEYLPQIKIGEDGLIVKSNYGSGLLLPQVFVEYSSTPHEALRMTCQKAGLQQEAWQDLKNVEIYKFQAKIFSEKEGNIVEVTP